VGEKLKKVLTYGTFDLLHWGHIHLLKRAKELGDHLTVGVSTDKFNEIKNKNSYYSYENRKIIIESIRFVDKVIPENSWDQKLHDIVENNIDLFVMGDDWQGKFDYLQEYCQVLYLPRTVGVSTTKIKDDLYSVPNV
jgi:glycerol-3-phosphate cytidylyltransferase